jgi:hypothetical protein
MRQYENCEEACRERRLELVNGGDYDELTAAAAAAQQARNLIMDLSEQVHQVKFMIRGRGSTSPPPRRGLRRGGDPDRALQRRYAPHEHDRRTLDRGMSTRTPGPHPDLEPGPSVADPEPVRDPPQSAPASPVAGRRCPAETATRTDLDQYRVRNTLASVV